MSPDDGYIAVKFARNTSNAVKDNILSNVLGSALESRTEMIVGLQNEEKDRITVCKLKESVSNESAAKFKNNLLKKKEIEYVGGSYKKNGKVVHLVTNEVIVKFRKNVSKFNIDNLNELYKTSVIEKVREFDNLYLLKISSRGGENSDNAFDISNKYAVTQFVDFAQPNFIRLGMLASPPNDSLLPEMWNIHNTGTNNPFHLQGTPGCDLDLLPAWEQTHGNPNVLMAIIDTGVDTNHIDLKGNLCDDRNLWYDAYDEDHWPYDEFSHGTAITGIAAAVGNNHIGTVGVAYGCKVMPIRVFGPWPEAATTDLILAKGLNWAWLHGADVLSNSWGGGAPTPVIVHAILNAVDFGRNGRGAVVFAASGNSDTNFVLFPSSMPEVICVGGISPCNERKSKTSCDNFNNEQNWGADYGENLSVVAPTPFIGTTLLLGGWCICANGTSSSCPQAAAIGALILSKNINLSGDSVKIIIERSAQKVGNYSYNISKPNGMWNNEMGYGRIDAKIALDMAPPGPSNIFDQVPPVIDAFVPPSGIYTSPLNITARIFDNEMVAGGSNSPRVYFYIEGIPVQFVSQSIYTSNNSYRFSIQYIPYGTKIHYYFAAQDTSSNNNVTTYPYGGRGVNPPGRIAPPKYLFWQNTRVYDTILASSDVPIPINESAETTIVSVLNNHINKTVLGVKCKINLDHSYDAELNISLIAPSRDEIVLASGVGNDGDNFRNTTFYDYASISIDDTVNSRPPFTGTFKPIERLWMLNGGNSAGVWKLKVVDNGGGDGGVLKNWSLDFKYSADFDNSNLPANFALLGNFPNPFNPVTRITFSVPYRAKIKITVYDLLGREVVKLINGFRDPALVDFVDFNTTKFSLASGVYFYSLVVDDKFIESKKMVLLK
jgi:subtilisin family serine protease/subtilisin-like proprotein convertase family protein